MKIVLNSSKSGESVPFSVALYLAILYIGDKTFHDIFEEACQKGYVVYDRMQPVFGSYSIPINPKLTESGIEYVESLLLNSEISEEVDNKDKYELLAEDLRSIYPSGRKPGTAYMWKDSVNVIATRLKGMTKKFGVSFTNEQAVNATRKYVESFCGDYRYMQLLKYFIMKKRDDTGDFESQLLSYISNENQEDSDYGESWVNELK